MRTEKRSRRGRALVLPVVAQPREQRGRQGHRAVLGALSVAHPDELACAIDVACFEPQSLAEAKAERVDGGEGHAAHGMTNGAEQGAHLAGAEHHRQHARLVDAKQVEHGPVALQRVDEEEAPARERQC